MSSSRLSRRASLRNASTAPDAADALKGIKKNAKRKGRPPKVKVTPGPRVPNKKIISEKDKAVVVSHIKANEPRDAVNADAAIEGDSQAQYGEIGYQWWLEPGSTTEEEDESEEDERPRGPDLEECLQDPMWCAEPCHNGCTNGEIFRAFKQAYIKYGATWPPDFERKRPRVRSRKAIARLEAEWQEREKIEQAKPRKAKGVAAQDSLASFVSYDSCLSPSVPGSTCSDQEPSSDAEDILKGLDDAAHRSTFRKSPEMPYYEEEDDAWDAEDEAPQAGPSRSRWQRTQEDEDEGEMSGTLCDEDVMMVDAEEDEDETMGDDESESDEDADYVDTSYKGKGKQRAEPVHRLRNHKGKGKARL